MIVTFHSIDNENEKVFFKTKGEQKDNSILFKDESMPNTTIELKINSSSVELIRSGDYNTNMVFEKNIPFFCRKRGFLSFLCNKMQGKSTCSLIFVLWVRRRPLFLAQ